MKAEVLRELSRSRTPVDRLRARATALAAAGMGVAVIAAASIAGLRGTEATAATSYDIDGTGTAFVEEPTVDGGLAPFLVQDGLRPGTVLAAVLLVLPFTALALQALRVGSVALDQQASRLSLAGATPADLRRVRVRRAGLAFGTGGLLAGPCYLVLWLALGPAVSPGWRLLPVPQAWLPLVWLAVAAALVVVGAALAVRSGRRRPDALSRGPAASPPPAPAVAWLSGLAAVGVLVAVFRAATASDGLVAAGLLVVVLLLLVCVHAVVTRRASATRSPAPASADRLPRGPYRLLGGRDGAVGVLAAAQRRANPRACGAVAGVLFVCGLSFGVAAAFSAGILLPSTDEYGIGSEVAFYVGGAGLAAAVGLVAAVVALIALALTLTDHLLTARRSVAATAALGADLRRLRAVQDRALTATAVPATVAGTLLAGGTYSLLDVGASFERVLPLLGVVLATALLAGLLVAGACRLVSVSLSARLRTAAALEHLRTP